MNRLMILGGAGVVGAIGLYMVMSRHSAAQSDATAGLGQYPIVMGGGGAAPAPATGGGSTDNSIAQMLAGQMGMATIQQQTALAGFQTQKDLATINATSALDLAGADLAKTKIQQLGSAFASLFGGPGAGSLNVAAPTITSMSNTDSNGQTLLGMSSTTAMGPYGGSTVSSPKYGATNSNTTQSQSQVGAGYTQGSIYGTIGFDQSGNLNVNMNRDTASSLTPIAN